MNLKEKPRISKKTSSLIDSNDDIVGYTAAYCVEDNNLYVEAVLWNGFDFNRNKWVNEQCRQKCINYLKIRLQTPKISRSPCLNEVIYDELRRKYPQDFN